MSAPSETDTLMAMTRKLIVVERQRDDLLAACETALGALVIAAHPDSFAGDPAPAFALALGEARSAIAKARGGQ